MGIATLRCGNTPLVRGHKTWIMGILNVTPDSFSDGGDFYDTQAAIAHGLELAANGADIIDVGGVSTAPNAKSVSAEQEHQRVIPVIKGLNGKGITAISIDTTRADVALAALEAGASWINDQSAGLFDPDMPSAMAKADGVVIMHNGGGVASGVLAGESVFYADIIDTLRKFFHRRLEELEKSLVDPRKIIVDPGVGFGKGLRDSIIIINNMHRLAEGLSLSLIGLSRKSFIGKMTAIIDPKARDFASLGAHAAAIFSGANIIRTHNVKGTREMAMVLDGILATGRNHENIY